MDNSGQMLASGYDTQTHFIFVTPAGVAPSAATPMVIHQNGVSVPSGYIPLATPPIMIPMQQSQSQPQQPILMPQFPGITNVRFATPLSPPPSPFRGYAAPQRFVMTQSPTVSEIQVVDQGIQVGPPFLPRVPSTTAAELKAPTWKNADYCTFCKSRGESPEFCATHRLKVKAVLIQCPILLQMVCPICGSTGQMAHTLAHCPFNQYNIQRRIDAQQQQEQQQFQSTCNIN